MYVMILINLAVLDNLDLWAKLRLKKLNFSLNAHIAIRIKETQR